MPNASQGLQDFWTNGFCVVPGVFREEEVESWRDAAIEHPQRDLLVDLDLRRLLLDGRVLRIAREILGDNDLIYFGDSNSVIGNPAAGFHKDNADKSDPDGPDWSGRYPLIRFGLYTQDHANLPGGLDLRRASHLAPSVADGEYVAARTRVGDLVVWNLRTSHSGDTMLMRNGQAVDPASVAGKILRRFSFGVLRNPSAVRVAIFWTFGLRGSHLDRYIAYLKTRRYAVDQWMSAVYDPAALEAAENAGVEIRHVRPEMEAHPPAELHENHVPLAY